MNRLRAIAKVVVVTCLVFVLVLSPLGQDGSLAARRGKTQAGRSPGPSPSTKVTGTIAEVAPPTALQALQTDLEKYQPQVTILSPRRNEVLSDNTVSVKFQVKDLPIFKDAKLGLGPHLHVLLDNRTYQAVYDLDQPLTFDNLDPGTHTIRAFASRPWHESFKNEGAYAQVTFHVYTKTQENSPDPALPLLTYSRPQGTYGAEPIMLDFYLVNAPLHLVAQENPKDDIADWRIRCTVNGESFVLDRWQPIYLKGFKPGKNWVQLEFLDEKGVPVPNVFNNTARVITYEPNGKDTLSRLVRGELAIADARGIVDRDYVPAMPAPIPTPTPSPSPTVSPTPVPRSSLMPTPSSAPVVPPIRVTPSPTPSTPSENAATPKARPVPSPSPVVPSSPPVPPAPGGKLPPVKPSPLSSPSQETVKPTPSPATDKSEKPEAMASPKATLPPTKPTASSKVSDFLNRLRSTSQTATPAPVRSNSGKTAPDRTPKGEPTPSPAPTPETAVPQPAQPTPTPEASPQPSPSVPPIAPPTIAPRQVDPGSPVNKVLPTPAPSVTPKSSPLAGDHRPSPRSVTPSPTPVPPGPNPTPALSPDVPSPRPVPARVMAPATPSPVPLKPSPTGAVSPQPTPTPDSTIPVRP